MEPRFSKGAGDPMFSSLVGFEVGSKTSKFQKQKHAGKDPVMKLILENYPFLCSFPITLY